MNKFAGIIAGSILASGFSGVTSDAAAEDLFAAKNIRAGAIISAEDIATPSDHDAMRRAVKLIGMEAVRTFYKGQPLDEENLRAPTLVKRNSIVQMEFNKGAMVILAEGRALDQGAMGERIRVMNLLSKRVVSATISGAGAVKAKQ
ncbi:MAG: flagella basal body P-ring formation protein FlgA [Hyphococcus sp.]|nr:MAG: flagella basal body P-ring formation protein FlgA [Marinicaulis sp.]